MRLHSGVVQLSRWEELRLVMDIHWFIMQMHFKLTRWCLDITHEVLRGALPLPLNIMDSTTKVVVTEGDDGFPVLRHAVDLGLHSSVVQTPHEPLCDGVLGEDSREQGTPINSSVIHIHMQGGVFGSSSEQVPRELVVRGIEETCPVRRLCADADVVG